MRSFIFTIFCIVILLISPVIHNSSGQSSDDFCSPSDTNQFYDFQILAPNGTILNNLETYLKSCTYSQLYLENNQLIFLDRDYRVQIMDMDDLIASDDFGDVNPQIYETGIPQTGDLTIHDITSEFIQYEQTTLDSDNEYADLEETHHVYRYIDGSDTETIPINLENYVEIPDKYSPGGIPHLYEYTTSNESGEIRNTLDYYFETRFVFAESLVIEVQESNRTMLDPEVGSTTESQVYREFQIIHNTDTGEIQYLQPLNITSVLPGWNDARWHLYHPLFNTSIMVNKTPDFTLNVTVYDHDNQKFILQQDYEGFGYFTSIDTYPNDVYIDENYIQFVTKDGVFSLDITSGMSVFYKYGDNNYHYDQGTGKYILRPSRVPGNEFLRKYETEVLMFATFIGAGIFVLFYRSHRSYKSKESAKPSDFEKPE